MPTDPLLGFDDPSDPGFKLTRGYDRGRGGAGAPSPGGGGGAFLSLAPAAGVAAAAQPGGFSFRRRPLDAPAYMPLAGGFTGLPSAPAETAAGTRGGAQPAGVMSMIRRSGRFGYPGSAADVVGGGNMGASPSGTGTAPAASSDPLNVANIIEYLKKMGLETMSPEGQRAQIEALKAVLTRKAQANRARASLMAKRYAPDDPRAQAFAALNSDINAGRSESDAVAEALAGMQDRNSRFGMNFLNEAAQNHWNWLARDQAGKIGQWGQDKGFDWGGLVGQVGGALLPYTGL